MVNLWQGPAPARAGKGPGPLSTQRAGILELLQTTDGAVTAAWTAQRLGLHVNTVREHLDALVTRDLAIRRRAPVVGRGRPAWAYEATQLTEHDPRVREYAGLATALAAHLTRTSSDPREDAIAAGRVWGAELMDERAPGDVPSTSAPPAEAEAEVTALLARLGFDPVVDGGRLALRRCPLLDAARRHPTVICGVHLGLVRGALDALGRPSEDAEIHPFAEPGACQLSL